MSPESGEDPRGRAALAGASARWAFLNIPYDQGFRDLYLAYIAGVSAFGLAPKVTLEIPGGRARRDRILELVQSCRYSLHDLSRVEIDKTSPPTLRFNMPFELGLALGWATWGDSSHTWFVFEAKKHRVQKSLSDLGGTDVHIHDGNRQGVFRELGNALVREPEQPTIEQMEAIYQRIRQALPKIMEKSGARSPFEARVFRELAVLARPVVDRVVAATPTWQRRRGSARLA